MRAARFHEFGDPSVLVVDDAPEPHAVAGSVRIAVRATSVNPIDYLLRSGVLQDVLPVSLPVIVGRDAVGVVDEVGEGVTDTAVGDFVFGLGGLSDTTGEHAILTAWSKVPATWTLSQAAAAGLVGVTAANVIRALGPLNDRTVLIDGASGGVGTAVAAFAIAGGARVIGTARPENHDYLKGLGVVPTTYGPGLKERVSTLSPKGVFAAVHSAPSDSLATLLEIVGETGRVVTVIDGEGAARLSVRKVDAENDSSLLDAVADLGAQGLYTPRVDHVLPFDAIGRGQEMARAGAGKVVIQVS